MSALPWVRFFPSDWLAGTRGMTAAETGVYITLIAMMYERGEPIPEDMPRLARLCGASNSQLKRTLDRLLEDEKIVRIEGGLWNDRVAKEQSYRSEKSDVGRQAAGQRWGKAERKQGKGDAKAMRSQCVRNAKPEARSQNTEPSGSAAPRDTDFDPLKLPEEGEGETPVADEDAAPFHAPAAPVTAAQEASKQLEHRLRDAAGAMASSINVGLADTSVVYRWLAAGADLDLDILPTIAGRSARQRSNFQARTWSYFEGAVLDAYRQRLALQAAAAEPSTNVVPFDPNRAPHDPASHGSTGRRSGRFAAAAELRRRQFAGSDPGGSDA